MLYIIRGLPGSGKSTLAKRLAEAAYAADDFFINDVGVYQFDATKLDKAHRDCQRKVKIALRGWCAVAVANTFSQLWEMDPYIKMAEELNIPYTILEVQTALTDEQLAARNVHGVPAEAIRRMRARWEIFPTP